MQGIFKHMKGAGEPEWTSQDDDDAFGEGSFNLSNPKVWGTKEGKERFEFALVDRLFYCNRAPQKTFLDVFSSAQVRKRLAPFLRLILFFRLKRGERT